MGRRLTSLVLLVAALNVTGNVARADLLEGLLVWHDFGNLVDGSGHGHDAVLRGNAQIADGLLQLDGDGDYADIGTAAGFGPMNPLVDALSDFTIAIAYATRDAGTYSSGNSTTLVSIGPDSGAGAADFSLLTASDAQTIHIEEVTFVTSRQSGIGYANGSVHLAIVTYDATLDLLTFYHLDDTGMAVSHGDSTVRAWDGDWSEQWDETLNYGIRLGRPRNSSLVSVEGLGDLTGQIDLFAIWDRALDVSEMSQIPSYTPARELARGASPSDGATYVERDVELSWMPGMYAATHNVYFGTDLDDVTEADAASALLVSPGQAGTRYDPPGLLDWGRAYYWRVDEVNAPPSSATVYKGKVWSFTVDPYAYPLTLGEQIVAVTASSYDPKYDPNNTVNGSGLDANDLHDDDAYSMWLSARGAPEPAWIQYEFDRVYKLQELSVWNYNRFREDKLGYGFKDVLIEYSTDGIDFTALDPVQLPWATGDAPVGPNTVPLNGISATHVRLTAQSNFKGRSQFGLSEVRLLYLPVWAHGPQPASGAVDVHPAAPLSWKPGREAAAHEVHLGKDANDLTLADTVTESSLAAPGLVLDETYYWHVNEVNEAETPTSWEGDIWHFTTSPFVVVDDFEGYGNVSPDRVFQTWIDGFGFSPDEHLPQGNPGNGTGAALGHDVWTPGSPHHMGDIMERTIVHAGRQSAPLYYNGMSEITRTFDLPQDWTAIGIKALTLYVHGSKDNTGGPLCVKVNGAKQAQSVDLAGPFWQEVNVDLGSLGASLQSVTSLTIGIEAGSGVVYIDDVRLYPSRCVPEKVLGDLTGDCIVDADDLAVIADNWLTRPLAVEYTFDSDLSDTSGNSRHGVGRNNPTVQSGVLTLQGTNFVDIPLGADNPFDGSRDFSVTMDFKTNARGVLLSSARNDAPDNHAMAIYIDKDPGEPFWGEAVYENFEVGAASAEDDEFFYELNTWHSLAVTYDADTEQVTVYLDEVAGPAAQFNPAIPNVAADTVRLGSTLNTASPDVGNLIGSLDNVRIFNFTLTPADVVLLPRVPLMPGDVNLDGVVDQADQDIVEANMGPLQLWP